jgi:hypothetical protein
MHARKYAKERPISRSLVLDELTNFYRVVIGKLEIKAEQVPKVLETIEPPYLALTTHMSIASSPLIGLDRSRISP